MFRVTLPLGLGLLIHCGAVVDDGTKAPGSTSTPTPAASSAPSASAAPTATTPVPPAPQCVDAGLVATFSADIVDLAVDATDVWALVRIAPDAWALERAPKCGGPVKRVGEQHASDTSSATPLSMTLLDDGSALVSMWDETSHNTWGLSRVTDGTVSSLDVTLWGPDEPPSALVSRGAAGYWGFRNELRTIGGPNPSSRTLVQGVLPNKGEDQYVADVDVSGNFVFGTSGKRVFRVDLTTNTVVQSSVLLMSDGPRFVRATGGAVFVIGADIARLTPDLTTHTIFATREHGTVGSVASHPDYLFFTRQREAGDEIYQATLDGARIEALPFANAGAHSELAVDQKMLYVARSGRVDRAPIMNP